MISIKARMRLSMELKYKLIQSCHPVVVLVVQKHLERQESDAKVA